MPSQSVAAPRVAADDAVTDVAKDVKEKLDMSKHASPSHGMRHPQRDSLKPTDSQRKLSVDDDDWRSPSPARQRGDFSAFSSNRGQSPSGRKPDGSPNPRNRRLSGHHEHHRRSTSPAAVSPHRKPSHNDTRGRHVSEDRGRPHLLAMDHHHNAGSRNHSQTRRGRSLSPGRGKKELAYTACRKFIVEGDHPDEIRAKIGEGDIVDVNELAFFGHSGSDGQTLLMVACKYGRKEIVKMLLDEYKADINMVGGLGRFNALHYAAWHGHPDCVRALLERGADYTAVNEDGETAETAARGHKKIEAADALAEWAKDPKCAIKPCAHETPNHVDHRRHS